MATTLWGLMFPFRRRVRRGRGACFQDIALQTFARVPEQGVDGRSGNRAGHAEREARLDRHAVGEPGAARRKLLQQVVLRQRMDEWHGMRGEIEREAAI